MIKKLANMRQELPGKDIKSETMLEDLMMERRFQSLFIFEDRKYFLLQHDNGVL